MSATPCAEPRTRKGFEHQAVFYRGLDGLVDAVLPLVREGVALGEPVLVALPPDRLVAVERALGAEATRVDLVDMRELGANPARLIPEWRRFLEEAGGGGPARGVAEPVWSGRRDPEVEEAVLHEALVNLAFEGGPPWQLLCPYDLTQVPRAVIEEAARHHHAARGPVDAGYVGPERARARFTSSLRPAPASADTVPFGAEDLTGLRSTVGRLSAQAGVARGAADDLVLAAHELATNSVLHGGGRGVLRAWRESDAFVVEICDTGVIDDPLVGRGRLDDLAENGRGIWMANQLCDLVQVRSGAAGTVVRLFAWL